jgi:hypothetical protein
MENGLEAEVEAPHEPYLNFPVGPLGVVAAERPVVVQLAWPALAERSEAAVAEGETLASARGLIGKPAAHSPRKTDRQNQGLHDNSNTVLRSYSFTYL